jgi:pimeloyl-ACP methyl ester carboxylesterase
LEASTFAELAEDLRPQWRLLALDQRGHGQSSHARSYTRNDYLGDLDAWFSHLCLTSPVVMLGHSLGGVNAYQFAARYPARVRALIIEDIGTEVRDDASFILNWAGVYPSRRTLEDRIGPRLFPYVENSLRSTAEGWTLAFDPHEILQSQQNICGDHWSDRVATDCPALLVRGAESRLTSDALFQQMVSRRPNTQLVTLAAGHAVHLDDREEYASAVATFLERV